MNLSQYKEKRDFKNTPEPTGGKAIREQLLFVVQKHHASSLHYDFRLEMGGVLKSWAVPKGPSVNPADKRLALMVEDHPYDYKDFEGIISEGNYGAGVVIVWDKGIYEPLEDVGTKKAREKSLLKQLKEGSMKFRLHGEKLNGEYALVRTAYSKNSWLLIKHKDEFATETDITEQGQSIISGKNLEDFSKTGRPKMGSLETESNHASHSVSIKKKS
ncbi:MAG: 3'-phosphoesterase [Phycisphaerae bacterium]|nr:3'-phosphoesterase [Saprospiraceae bacterium]